MTQVARRCAYMVEIALPFSALSAIQVAQWRGEEMATKIVDEAFDRNQQERPASECVSVWEGGR